MTEDKTFWDKLLASGKDALNPLKLLMRLAIFFVFGILTAFKYVIFNLNNISQQAVGDTLLLKIWAFLSALTLATWKGMFIGLSTLFDTLIHLNEVISTHQYGTMFYAFLVLFFGIWTLYQPIAILFDIADMQKGQHYNKMWAFLTSFVLLIVIVSPISYLALDGETLTSDITEDDYEVDDMIVDEITNTTNNESLINVIDLTGGS